jgi:ribonuclease HI
MSTSPRWIPPPNDLVKANVDGAVSRDNGKDSAAVIFRDREGHYLGSSAIVFLGVTDPPSLEALACHEALSLAADLPIQRVYVASDCKQVVNDIDADSGGVFFR